MITYFHIENFKSLVDFDLPLAGQELGPFTCLIGLNGAGKSTVLQAFDFIAHVATGKVEEWLASRDWKKNELTSNLGVKKHVIVFALGFRPTSGPVIEWKARFNVNQLKCTWEQVSCEGNILLKLDEGRLDLLHDPASEERTILASLPFEYHGSVLSALKLGNFHWCIGEVKTQLLSLRSLELLSPQSLRRRAKKAEDIGVGGEKLSAFLSSFGPEQRDSLLTKLQEFSPSLKSWQVHTLRAGWKNLRITERYGSGLAVDASHVNDGLLRILAILAQSESSHRFLLFDEIENGINPALAGKLMDFLVGLDSSHKQVLVTTHSPVLLNFLEDTVACKSVFLVYRTPEGRTNACRYFEQPETLSKLRALGPGEVFLDTDLEKMVTRLGSGTKASGRP